MWRWQPPVLSPVPPSALLGGLAAACGLRERGGKVAPVLKERFNASDVILTDSGTSALILALRALVPAGATIAYPSYACIDLTAAALRAGMRVRLYDLDPTTLSPNLDSVRATIGRGVDAIVVAHLYGYPADVAGVQKLAALHGIPVIEDAAQAAGGTLHGRRLGSFGDISILSFGRGKGTTCGSGGAVLCLNPALTNLAHRMRAQLGAPASGVREVGVLAAQWLLSRPFLYRLPASIPGLKLGEMVYHAAGEPRPMSAAAATMLSTTLEIADRELRCRRDHAYDLLTRLNGTRRVMAVRPIAGGESGFLRAAFIDSVGDWSPRPALGALRGYPLTLEEQPELQSILAPGERAGKGAALLRDRLFTLPTHSHVADRDVGRLSDWLASPTSASQAVPASAFAT
jgi:perosamine synthetase